LARPVGLGYVDEKVAEPALTVSEDKKYRTHQEKNGYQKSQAGQGPFHTNNFICPATNIQLCGGSVVDEP
jgi:hypothetical protein